MSLKSDAAFTSLSNLTLWYKIQDGDTLVLTDIPAIIPLRLNEFKKNWDFIKGDLINKIPTYRFPSLLRQHINDFSAFIEKQRTSKNINVNPLLSSSTLSQFYAVFDVIEIASVPISKEENDIIEAKIAEVNAYTRTDFQSIRNDINAAREELSDIVEGEDADYNATFDRSSVPSVRTASVFDILRMVSLQDGIRSVDFILANSFALDTVTIDPFALARANASNPDIEIPTGNSGFLARMQQGESLQSVAFRFLGDPDRWIEIAIANGLRAPYVDEVGESVPLIANGSGSQINVAAFDTNGNRNIEKFFIGQVLFLSSTTVIAPDQRTVISIKEVPVSGEIIVELDGEPDLEKFKINEVALVRVFKPNTINSNFFIMIPSAEEASNNAVIDVPFFLKSKGEDEKRAGVDLLLSPDKDLSFTSFNDLALSFGVENAAQAVQLKLETEQGSRIRHPAYGIPSTIGLRTQDIGELRNIIITGINEAIDADARFARVESLRVRYEIINGPASLIVNLVVRMAGSGTLIPLSFTVNNG